MLREAKDKFYKDKEFLNIQILLEASDGRTEQVCFSTEIYSILFGCP